MGQHGTSMTAQVRFANLLEPVLSEIDDARIAVVAARILRDGALPDIDVVPLDEAPAMSDATIYAVRGDPVQWHAVRLLIEQGKLAADARVPVRIFLSPAQWRRAGLVARIAEVAHRIALPVMRRKRAAGRAWSPRDLVRHL
jgi:hypothetical protein